MGIKGFLFACMLTTRSYSWCRFKSRIVFCNDNGARKYLCDAQKKQIA